MTEEQWIQLISAMQLALEAINGLKGQPDVADSRGLAIAATYLETAMLWVANSRKT